QDVAVDEPDRPKGDVDGDRDDEHDLHGAPHGRDPTSSGAARRLIARMAGRESGTTIRPAIASPYAAHAAPTPYAAASAPNPAIAAGISTSSPSCRIEAIRPR